MEENKDSKIIQPNISLPDFDEKTKQKICLAIYHDGLEVTTSYVNNIMERFQKYFNKTFLVSEDDENLESLRQFDNFTIVKTLKPIRLGGEWILILEPGEFPSIQFLNSLSDIISNLKNEVKIVRFPLVICDFKSGEIINILKPVSRLFRQNPQLLQKSQNEEIILEDYPLIKLYVDFEQFENDLVQSSADAVTNQNIEHEG
jgi:hypothetical protein